jgi:superfamily II DNA/RNA helicase
VDDVTHVVNYECPEDEKTYLHRIGRTGRAGRSGVAVTFVDWHDLQRWKLISDALGLDKPEPAETYSTSEHLFSALDIPAGVAGVLPRAQRDRAGLEAEELEDIGETGRTRSQAGHGSGGHGSGGHGSGGHGSDGHRQGGRGPDSGREAGRRSSRVRRRTRGGAPVGGHGDGNGDASAAQPAADVTAGDPAGPAAGADGQADPARRRRRRRSRGSGSRPASAAQPSGDS